MSPHYSFKPDLLAEISDDGKLGYIRLSTGNAVEPSDAIREDLIIPARHAQAVHLAITGYLRKESI